MPFHWERLTATDRSPNNRGQVEHDDEVLNAKLIRRTTYRELLDTPIKEFFLQPQPSQSTKDELTTSEGPACADDSYFSKVDHLGLREAAFFRRRRLRFQTMDSMIEEARQERARPRATLTVGRRYFTFRR
ncbi:hypothetical protein LTS08_003142 [Lithohypha guttulata]|nr:hypothetical protein LTS08_003142 [Lithohypha guttulata]